MNIGEHQEDDLLYFLTKYPVLKEEKIPISVIRLCFFSGYNAGLELLENILHESSTKD